MASVASCGVWKCSSSSHENARPDNGPMFSANNEGLCLFRLAEATCGVNADIHARARRHGRHGSRTRAPQAVRGAEVPREGIVRLCVSARFSAHISRRNLFGPVLAFRDAGDIAREDRASRGSPSARAGEKGCTARVKDSPPQTHRSSSPPRRVIARTTFRSAFRSVTGVPRGNHPVCVLSPRSARFFFSVTGRDARSAESRPRRLLRSPSRD